MFYLSKYEITETKTYWKQNIMLKILLDTEAATDTQDFKRNAEMIKM